MRGGQLTLNNEVTLPAIGLGVFQSEPDQTCAAVTHDLRAGYLLIDTAASYGNKRAVGEAIAESGVPRDEVVIETKVWISDYSFDETRRAFDKSAGTLGVDQIDLLILHQPLPTEFERTFGRLPWAGDLALRREGARDRGEQLHGRSPDAVLDAANVVPAVNQIEVYPYFTPRDVQELGAQNGRPDCD